MTRAYRGASAAAPSGSDGDGGNGRDRRARRAGPIVAAVVGALLVVFSFGADWMWSSVAVYQGQGGFHTDSVHVGIADVEEAWAGVYRFGTVVLVVLVAAALVVPPRLRRGVGLAALGCTAALAWALVTGWGDLDEAVRQEAALGLEVVSEAPDNQVDVEWGRPALAPACVGVALLAAAAASAAWPAARARVLAAAGTVTGAAWLVAPFAVAHVGDPGPGGTYDYAAVPARAMDIGASGQVSAVLTVALAGLAWAAALGVPRVRMEALLAATAVTGALLVMTALGLNMEQVRDGTSGHDARYIETTFSPFFLACTAALSASAVVAARHHHRA